MRTSLTSINVRADCKRIHSASKGCWLSSEELHTGWASMWTDPEQCEASIYAEHFRLLPCVHTIMRTAVRTSHTSINVRADCKRIHSASQGCWPSSEGFHTGMASMQSDPEQLEASS